MTMNLKQAAHVSMGPLRDLSSAVDALILTPQFTLAEARLYHVLEERSRMPDLCALHLRGTF